MKLFIDHADNLDLMDCVMDYVKLLDLLDLLDLGDLGDLWDLVRSCAKMEFTVRYTRQITALFTNISIKIHSFVCIKQA